MKSFLIVITLSILAGCASTPKEYASMGTYTTTIDESKSFGMMTIHMNKVSTERPKGNM